MSASSCVRDGALTSAGSLRPISPSGVDHGDAQPGAAEERGPRPSEHLPGSLAPRVDEVGRGEPRRPGRVVRRVRAAVKAARALGDQLFV